MIAQLFSRSAHGLLVAASVLFLAGCATGPQTNPTDPLEPLNRSVFRFNDSLDENVLKPVATGYRDYTPTLVQTGVRNVFNNFSDVSAVLNNGLQLKGRQAASSLMRVVVNTTVGVYGLFDVATAIKLERYPEDFGQTLGYWGVRSGPYLVLPLLGPSTVRDTAGLPVDWHVDPVSNARIASFSPETQILRIVDRRAGYLAAGNLLNEASIDKYAFLRDAYLQRRRSQIFDGNPPDQDLPDQSQAPSQSSK
ncbi:MlaA family lipoprotein [Limnohabitans sp.]|uniref:MlaA family lipoprotein n=1 Tax=Limnohabitans sp. TaxID=1907725 RepID=UPI002FDDE516